MMTRAVGAGSVCANEAGPPNRATGCRKKSDGAVGAGGVITEFTIPTANSGPYEITSGPDGNLWFTEINTNKIGKITTAGVITEFTVPTANSGPLGITTGPDGNLWFTEGGGKIAKCTTAGRITEGTVTAA